MNIKPLIGVTPWYDYNSNEIYIKPGYCEGIIQAGGLPVLLPLSPDKQLFEDLFERVSGILLSGGPDVDAKHFREFNMPYNEKISPYRDAMELYLAQRAIAEGKPVFGICRGMQVMNVAVGGSLYQDIGSQIKDRAVLKHSQEAPKWYPTHAISIKEGSRVRQAHGEESIEVNSFHHQAVKDAAVGFEITALSPDGVIEAIEYKGHPFAVGVQWHPELMWKEDRTFLKLFEDFVVCCGECWA